MKGCITEHHKLMLRIHRDNISDKEAQLKRLNESIDKATEAYRVEIELLDTIPGVGKEAVGVGMNQGNCETGVKKNVKWFMATVICEAH